MNEMIERVATALSESFKARVATAAGVPFDATGVQLPNADLWRDYAQVAIIAMREPTIAMRYDGWAPTAFAPEVRVSSLQFDPAPVWTAMIDAALKE